MGSRRAQGELASARRSLIKDRHWVIAFLLLLCAVSATPVLAASPGEPVPPVAEEFSEAGAYEGEPVPPELGKVEEEEKEQEEWLASPEAEQQREVSWQSYGDISAAEAEELLRTKFAEQLEILNDDPARFLSDAQVIQPIGESAATVKSEGETSLLESSVPLRAENDEGDLAKVDLGLEPSPEGFETTNAISEIALPASASEGVEVGEEGFSIAQAGADPQASARPFGDKNVFYPEALPDTDLFVAPNATGVELFDILRSKESPEDLRFDIELPPGAVLRAGEGGGAEVIRAGKVLKEILPPVAEDAQGTSVPTDLEVEGNALVLHVAHREGDYAAPILVDPIVEDWANVGVNWYEGHNPQALTNGAWTWASGNGNIAHDVCCWWGKNIGLLINMKAAFYGPEQFGQWSYRTPNAHSYIEHAWITPFWREDYGCKSAQPHDYAGIVMEPGEKWNPVYANYAGNHQAFGMDGYGQAFIIGEGSGPPGVWISCDRVLYAGGVALWLNDLDYPYIGSVSGVPSGWISDETPFTLSVNEGDEGLGLRSLTVNPEKSTLIRDLVECNGLYEHRCPTTRNSTFTLSGLNFLEGKRPTTITAQDALGKTSSNYKFELKIDNTPPEVKLSGQLAKATNEEVGFGEKDPAGDQGKKGEDELSLPVYNLRIEAKDGSNATNAQMRSGVKNVEVLLDGNTMSVPWSANPTPCDSCELNQTYQLKLDGLAAGVHTLKVIAVDQVKKKLERSIEFEYFPATGMKEEYVLQRFPLPNGQGNEAEEENPDRPELAVNVMNGNLVYREKDVEVDGYGADLEVERYYNSMLPAAENTEWGDGWTLAQTPLLSPEKGGAPKEAELLDASGAVEGGVVLPTETGKTTFNPALQATIVKEAGGGYAMADESGETGTEVAFDSAGRTDELRTEGYAKVDYGYAAGKLDEIAVKDPASAGDISEVEEKALEYIPPAPSFQSAFGALGTGDGQLKTPGDIAIAANGDLFAVDRGNNRIERFNQEGKFVSKFGSLGSANGQFNRPCSIAIDASGNLWVADANNSRIEKFNEKGEFVKAVGALGTGNAQFKEPEGIATDAKGNVYVADTYNARIQKFNSAGEFLAKFGSSGTGNGQFNQVNSIDVGPGGKVWAADWSLNRITQFDEAGGYAQKFGSSGTGNGQFSHPDAIEVDSRGNVFVADLSNNRVQEFGQAGQYLTQFGTKGSGNGQFSFALPIGIAVDNKGGLWIADVSNNRIEKWSVSGYRPSWYGAFGSLGTADGQLKTPGDIAIAQNGEVWVVDRGNNRVERFNQEGKFVSKFGSLGSAAGQFSRPTSIAIGGNNHLWVADANNNRIEEFGENGEFIKAIGSAGAGNSQFNQPEGIATDLKGNVYVADTYNQRIEKFNEAGEFVSKFGSAGSGAGQFTEANAIDIGRGGKVWVADWGANRIEQFNEKGEFALQFGSSGTGEGQFSHPDAIEADSRGNVWVGDQSNGRVELFNEAGEYVTQFGVKGSGEGQFSFTYPMGIAADASSGFWIADVSNNRIQKWLLPNTEPPKVPEENDPSVDVKLSEGLVSSVEGHEAGVNTYAHSGDDLTAHKGPLGETKYAYDTSGRMTKVELPNGNKAAIAYNQTYGRVSSVTTTIAGVAKTTYFTYSDEPRRTEVAPPDSPTVTYDIGDDGSVLRWWNTPEPPTIRLSGDLYAEKETQSPIPAGDHLLEVEGYSTEGISSIQIIADGDQLIKEKTCAQDFEKKETECVKETAFWVTNTNDHPPGILNLEAIVTNGKDKTESKRFWVNIPQPPLPPAEGAPVAPTFKSVLDFREEFGLDVVDPVANEQEQIERVFGLIGAWWDGDPVARASAERWGAPMRPKDVAEMEYRDTYFAHNAALIDEWASLHYPDTFAGYYIDNRAGGIVYVGFAQEQSARLAELEQQLPLIAPDRLRVFPSPPKTARVDLDKLDSEIDQEWMSNSALTPLITETSVSEEKDTVEVGAANVSQVAATLAQVFGAQAPITVIYQPEQPESLSSRFQTSGRILAGDNILNVHEACSAGFGAFEKRIDKITQKLITAHFLLTAGHCFDLEGYVHRSTYTDFSHIESWAGVGEVTRSAFGTSSDKYQTDAEAIRLESDGLAPKFIHGRGEPVSINEAERAHIGQMVCFSGARTGGVRCKKILALKSFRPQGQNFLVVAYQVNFEPVQGDSGGPVWNPRSRGAIGLVVDAVHGSHTGYVVPLVRPPHVSTAKAPGVLNAPGLDPSALDWE